jgi:phosphate:Na+ symporter
MSKFIASDNEHLRKAYNDSRKIILKVLREILSIQQSDNPEDHLKTLEKYTQKAIQGDVVKGDKLNILLSEKAITNEMATSLMNDSAIVVRIIRNLVSITELLYIRRDRLLE